jgi:hypothetical protein
VCCILFVGALRSITKNARLQVIEAEPENGTGAFKWVHGNFAGKDIWMHEDMVYYEGDIEEFGLGKTDLYPASMGVNRWWVHRLYRQLGSHSSAPRSARFDERQ